MHPCQGMCLQLRYELRLSDEALCSLRLTDSVLCLEGLGMSLAVFALDPDSVHGQLLASVYLQTSIYQVLHLLQPRFSEHVMELNCIKKKKEGLSLS